MRSAFTGLYASQDVFQPVEPCIHSAATSSSTGAGRVIKMSRCEVKTLNRLEKGKVKGAQIHHRCGAVGLAP